MFGLLGIIILVLLGLTAIIELVRKVDRAENAYQSRTDVVKKRIAREMGMGKFLKETKAI